MQKSTCHCRKSRKLEIAQYNIATLTKLTSWEAIKNGHTKNPISNIYVTVSRPKAHHSKKYNKRLSLTCE